MQIKSIKLCRLKVLDYFIKHRYFIKMLNFIKFKYKYYTII